MELSKSQGRATALWGILVLVPFPTLGTVMGMYVLPGPVGQTIYGLCKLWILCVPLLWLRFVFRQPVSWSPMQRGGLWTGSLLGIAVAGAILATYEFLGPRLIDAERIRLAARRTGIDHAGVYFGFAAYLIFVNSLLEEYVWRWFVFRQCEVLKPGLVAVVLSALLFTIHHVAALRAQFDWPVTVICSLGVLLGGMIMSWCYLRFRSIWPGYACHVGIDLAILIIGWRLIFPS